MIRSFLLSDIIELGYEFVLYSSPADRNEIQVQLQYMKEGLQPAGKIEPLLDELDGCINEVMNMLVVFHGIRVKDFPGVMLS